MGEDVKKVDEKREKFKEDFVKTVGVVLKGTLISSVFAGVGLATYSPYMKNVFDIAGGQKALADMLNGTHPVVEQLLPYSIVMKPMSDLMKQVAQKKEFFKMKGEKILYSIAEKIYDSNPEKFESLVKEKKEESFAESLAKYPLRKIATIEQAKKLLIECESGKSPLDTITNSIMCFAEGNTNIARLILERLKNEGLVDDKQRGIDAIKSLRRNSLGIRTQKEYIQYLDYINDNSKLSGMHAQEENIHNQEFENNKIKKFFMRFAIKKPLKQIEDGSTQRIRNIIRQEIAKGPSKANKEEEISRIREEIAKGINEYELSRKLEEITMETLENVSSWTISRQEVGNSGIADRNNGHEGHENEKAPEKSDIEI